MGLGASARPLTFEVQADEISIAKVLAGLNRSDIAVDGTTSFRADVMGTVDEPQAMFQMSGANLIAYREASCVGR